MSDDMCRTRSIDDCDQQEERSKESIARPDGGNPSIDEVLKMLRNRRRRAIFYYLREHEVATVDELAAHLAALETETPVSEGDVDLSERIELELVHTALPKMADSHFIEYDSRSSTVRYADPPEHLQLLLGVLKRFDDPPSG